MSEGMSDEDFAAQERDDALEVVLNAALRWLHELVEEVIPNADPVDRRGYEDSAEEIRIALNVLDDD